MAAILTEESLRERLNLHHDNLEDVKSLSLPGTYQEKVSSVGNAARKFIRLKHLDLSRNAINTLAGLDQLKLLETLNLYYNNIGSLDELKRLRHNVKLRELDLRLNPIAREEPDYRLYLIHLLPSLQKLDDRGVRDRERQAALIHFSTSQATEFSAPDRQSPLIDGGNGDMPSSAQPRIKSMNLINKVSALDDDDVAVLDLIARTGGDLAQPRHITGSENNGPAAEHYTLEGLKAISNIAGQTKTKTLGEESHPESGATDLYPNLARIPDRIQRGNGLTSVAQHEQIPDVNLQFQDECEAYTKYKGRGYFTPTPHHGTTNDKSESTDEVVTAVEQYTKPSPQKPERVLVSKDPVIDRLRAFPVQRLEFDSVDVNGDVLSCDAASGAALHLTNSSQYMQSTDPSIVTAHPPATLPAAPIVPVAHRDVLMKLLDLVDKYWNGTRSLHKNPKFKNLALNMIKSFEACSTSEVRQRYRDSSEQLHADLAMVQQENSQLLSLQEKNAAVRLSETQLKQSLQDVKQLRKALHHTQKENTMLQQKLHVAETNQTLSASTATVSQTQLDNLQKENQDLEAEISNMHQQLQKVDKLNQLTNMLQESHRSLVRTNDQLLKELSETKERHRAEVQQLHWNYDQLKETLSYAGSTSASVSRESAAFHEDVL